MNRSLNGFVVAVCLMGSTFAQAAPDLIVEQFTRVGDIRKHDGRHYVPVEVKVKNQGSNSASLSKVSVDYWRSGKQFTAPFSLNGQSTTWYPFIASLASGKSISLRGSVIIHIDAAMTGTVLTVTADSCSGDELMPDFCRIKENDEDNNKRNLYVIF